MIQISWFNTFAIQKAVTYSKMSLTLKFSTAIIAIGFILTVGWTTSFFSVDWDSCADDLDRLRRAARDAADVANDVKSKAEEFHRCRRYPDIYDLMGDRCRSKAWDYESALRTLETELSNIDSRIRSVSSSCGYSLRSIGSPSYSQPGVPSSGSRLCDLFRSYKDKVPLDTLLKICSQSMSDDDCKKCLSEK